MPKPSDANLVKRALQNDTDAFALLVRRHMPAVSAVAMAYTRHPADAEDVAQEALLKAWKSLDTLRKPQRFGGWVVTIARNCARSHFNRKQQENKTLEAYRRETAMMPHSENIDHNSAMQRLLPELVADLPLADRELVLLRYQGGRKTREIAGLLNLSHAAVRKRLERIRRSLGKALLASLQPEAEEQQQRDRHATKIASAIVAIPPGWKHAVPASAATASIGLATALKGLAIVCIVLAVPVMLTIQNQNDATTPEATPSITTAPSQIKTPAIEATSIEEPETVINAALPVVSSPETTSHGGTISGRVFEEDTGQGIKDALIQLYARGSTEANERYTDSEGKYHYDNLAAGEYTIYLRRNDDFRLRYPMNNYAPQSKSLILKENSTLDKIDFSFIRGVTVRGQVVDTEGKPLAGANIHGWSQPNSVEIANTTDEEGFFTFQGFDTSLPAFFWPHYPGWSMPPHGPVQIPEGGLDNLVLVMQPETVLSGKLVDQEGNGLPQTRIWPWPKNVNTLFKELTVVTDDRGAFEIRGLHASTYRFSITLPGEDDSRRLADSEITELRQGETRRNVELCYVFPGDLTISGKITDDQGKALQHINIWAGRGSFTRSTTSDAQGMYTLVDLEPGIYQVKAARTYIGLPDHHVEAEAGTQDLDFEFTRLATVQGTVIDADTDEAITMFEVMDQHGPLNWKAFSNEDGQFKIGRLNPGELSIFVRAPGYASGASEKFTLASGETRNDIIVRLEKAGIVTGTVFDPDGNPIRDADVGIDDGVTGGLTRSDAKGRFEIDDARPGTWPLLASHTAYAHGETTITVVAGETTEANVHLKTGATLTGNVVKGGAPVKDIKLELTQHLDMNVMYSRNVTTDTAGNYRFNGIPTGKLRLRLNPMLHGQGRVITIPVIFEDDKSENLDIEIYMGPADVLFTVDMSEALHAREGTVWIDLEYHFTSGESDRYYTITQHDETPYLEGVRPGKALLSARYYSAEYHMPLSIIEAHEITLQDGVENHFTLSFSEMEPIE